MRLHEIDDVDKSYLTLRGIKFDFISDYNNVLMAISVIGRSASRRILLKDDIDNILHDIDTLRTFGFPESDPDIIISKNIYNKLQDIKDTL